VAAIRRYERCTISSCSWSSIDVRSIYIEDSKPSSECVGGWLGGGFLRLFVFLAPSVVCLSVSALHLISSIFAFVFFGSSVRRGARHGWVDMSENLIYFVRCCISASSCMKPGPRWFVRSFF